jgi:hypothetical protein
VEYNYIEQRHEMLERAMERVLREREREREI